MSFTEQVAAHLEHLDGSTAAAVTLITGLDANELADLGGIR